LTSLLDTPFTRQVGVEVPLIGGAMYPCSNPELVAAVSQAGGIGVLQPLSLVYVFKHDFRDGVRKIKTLTGRPFGMNVIVEKSSKTYQDRMKRWLDIALDEGCRFFVTSLGNPRWVVERAKPEGVVYHDVTERKWAEKALAEGVHGIIAVNSRAGGHAGAKTPEALMGELGPLGVPLVCAGGIGSPDDFVKALRMGYAAVQMGTRFIATDECSVHADYKQAILKAREEDIVLTEKLTGVPVAVIKTPHIEKTGTRAGPIARLLLRSGRTKHWMRSFYALRAVWQLKRASLEGMSYKDYFQAGKSVAGIDAVEPVGAVVRRFADAARAGG
jgi:nitronate monooxygenase